MLNKEMLTSMSAAMKNASDKENEHKEQLIKELKEINEKLNKILIKLEFK